MSPAVLAGLLGIAQGMRHALEPDHVTAVATVMVRTPSPLRGMSYAASWGLGHASMLVLMGGALVALRIELPPTVAMGLEVVVGIMLVGLGLRALRDAKRDAVAVSASARAAAEASSADVAAARDHRPRHSHAPLARAPFLIGLVHGLAGSSALAALVALTAPTGATALGCLALYGFGTTVGMVLLAAVVSPVLSRAGRLPRVAPMLVRIAGVTSIVVGVVWIARTLTAGA